MSVETINFGPFLTKAGSPTDGVFQVETATVAGTITGSGDVSVVVTAAGLTGSPLTVTVAVLGGVAQVETATVIGTIGAAGAGDVEVIVTAAGMNNTPKTVGVAVANNDTAAQVAGKIRTALQADADIGHTDTGFFVVTGSDAQVVLTAKAQAANDATMNISIDNDTSSGLTPSPTSANTTAGALGDVATAVAAKVRAALAAHAVISAFFTVGGSTDKVILTAKNAQANDTSMNIALDNDTSTGLTPAASSANTTAGVAGDFHGVGSSQVMIDTTNRIIYQNSGDHLRPVWTAQ